jgi:predicted permease
LVVNLNCVKGVGEVPPHTPGRMNTLLKNWHMCLYAYLAAAAVAAPIFMKDIELALPFYSAQLFIVVVTAAMSLVFIGLERIVDDLEGPHILRLVGERVHQS